MKDVISKDVGPGKAGVFIDDVDVMVGFKVAKAAIVAPIMAKLDPLKAQLEALIPGDWENPAVDAIFKGIEDELVLLLTGQA